MALLRQDSVVAQVDSVLQVDSVEVVQEDSVEVAQEDSVEVVQEEVTAQVHQFQPLFNKATILMEAINTKQIY